MARKAQEGMAKLGGEGFMSELRDMYADRRGVKKVTVRQNSGGAEVQFSGSDQGR